MFLKGKCVFLQRQMCVSTKANVCFIKGKCVFLQRQMCVSQRQMCVSTKANVCFKMQMCVSKKANVCFKKANVCLKCVPAPTFERKWPSEMTRILCKLGLCTLEPLRFRVCRKSFQSFKKLSSHILENSTQFAFTVRPMAPYGNKN